MSLAKMSSSAGKLICRVQTIGTGTKFYESIIIGLVDSDSAETIKSDFKRYWIDSESLTVSDQSIMGQFAGVFRYGNKKNLVSGGQTIGITSNVAPFNSIQHASNLKLKDKMKSGYTPKIIESFKSEHPDDEFIFANSLSVAPMSTAGLDVLKQYVNKVTTNANFIDQVARIAATAKRNYIMEEDGIIVPQSFAMAETAGWGEF